MMILNQDTTNNSKASVIIVSSFFLIAQYIPKNHEITLFPYVFHLLLELHSTREQ